MRVLSSLDLMIRSPDTSSQMIEAKSKKGRRDERVNVSLVFSRHVPECHQREVAELATSIWMRFRRTYCDEILSCPRQ